MVNFLSSWVKNLALALIIVSILEMILPNNKTKKYIKMVMGLYILFSIIAPFIENSSKFNVDNLDVNSYIDGTKTTLSLSEDVDQTSMDKRLNQIYKEELEKDISKKVEEKGYTVESCKVDANISKNDSSIKKITLKIGEKTSKSESNQKNVNTVEDKIVKEVQKIQKVNISVSKDDEDIKENEKSMANEEENVTGESIHITKTDIKIIKDLLINEYGVSEECLKIS